NRNINEHTLFTEEKHDRKMLKTLEMCYHSAPYYADTMALIRRVMNCGEDNLARFLAFGIKEVARYLGMNTVFYFSSEFEKDNTLKAMERILDICSRLGADTYINAIGGRALYHAEDFEKRGMQLYFLKMDEDIVYEQGKGEFLPSLSIIDVMMYNSPEEIRELLKRFSLIP
ncbi:MAG: WbqC family protein, partial [Eubacteriales bacterium]|nr:WbqC family protein [Eubacteriales bacterium]